LKYAAISFAAGIILFVLMHVLHNLVFTMENFDKPARESVLEFLTKQGYAMMFWSAVCFVVGVGFGFAALLQLP
jgi:peptidoglycan biosynthesis protein MviN/MurJ (putative lipid II flippase)